MEEDFVTFAQGVLGFPQYRRWRIVPVGELFLFTGFSDAPVPAKDSMGHPITAYVPIQMLMLPVPHRMVPDFKVPPNNEVVERLLGTPDMEGVQAYLVLNRKERNRKDIFTANMLGPVFVHPWVMRGCQTTWAGRLEDIRHEIGTLEDVLHGG